jgi:flavin-binding protein dodecin
MANVVRIIAVLGQSKKNLEDAAKAALDEAKESLRHIRSCYITELEASVENGEVVHYRITRRPFPAFFGHGTN